MAPTSPAKFVDHIFFTGGAAAAKSLSYVHDELWWLIGDHLLSFLDNFPSFSVSAADFFHNDGTTVRLLNATGFLPSPPPHTEAPVPVTIWLHQAYPYHPPLVFVSLPPDFTVPSDHPFINADGAATCPYIDDWKFPESNLSELADNLVKIFSVCPLHPSRREVVDELLQRLNTDLEELKGHVINEIDINLSLQSTLKDRADNINVVIKEIEAEKERLEESVLKMKKNASKMERWLKSVRESYRAFENPLMAADDESRHALEAGAADLAIDDLCYALDKGLEEGVLGFAEYMKRIRVFSRKQFLYRAMVVKLQADNHS